jgi:hypothetical protein
MDQNMVQYGLFVSSQLLSKSRREASVDPISC